MRCRQPRYKPETWPELAESGMDEDEVVIAMLKAAKEALEEMQGELAEARARIAELEGRE